MTEWENFKKAGTRVEGTIKAIIPASGKFGNYFVLKIEREDGTEVNVPMRTVELRRFMNTILKPILGNKVEIIYLHNVTDKTGVKSMKKFICNLTHGPVFIRDATRNS